MNGDEIKKIENTFRASDSHDELFDAFQNALKINLSDIGVYKILIANPALSPDEIKMFTEKLIKEYSSHAFDLLMWSGKIFENKPELYNQPEEALKYYSRAWNDKPTSSTPLLKILNLYNYDIQLSSNKTIIDLVENSVAAVDDKSRVYYALSDHYRKTGDKMREIRYFALAEKASERENL